MSEHLLYQFRNILLIFILVIGVLRYSDKKIGQLLKKLLIYFFLCVILANGKIHTLIDSIIGAVINITEVR